MGVVWEHFPEGGSLLLTMLALADHCDDQGDHIFPSNAHLARKTRQSERTVQYQRKRIEEMGWLVPVANEQGGRGKATEYRIPLEDLELRFQGSEVTRGWDRKGAEVAPFSDAEKGAKGAKVAPFSGVEKGAKGAIAVAPQSSINPNPKTYPPIVPPQGDGLLAVTGEALSRWFEAELWPQYPKRVAKAQALAVLAELRPDATMLEAIKAGLAHRKHAAQHYEATRRFMPAWPDLHRWLKKRRWEDRFDVPRETSSVPRCQCGALGVVGDGRRWYCRAHDPDHRPSP